MKCEARVLCRAIFRNFSATVMMITITMFIRMMIVIAMIMTIVILW